MKNAEMKSGKTMAELLNELNGKVNTYNKSTDNVEKIRIEVESKDIVEQYNELSKLALYANALTDEIPIAFVVKAHHYPTISAKFVASTDIDETGKLVAVKVGAVNTGNKNVDLFDFINWAEKSNKKVAANGNWKAILGTQRDFINKEFRKSIESDTNYTVSKNTANDVLQACFDALVFVPGKSGKNSIFPNKDCKNLIVACAAEYKETITDSNDVDPSMAFFKTKRWYSTIQSALFLILKNKTIVYTYGDPEESKVSAVKKSEVKAEDSTKTDAKSTKKVDLKKSKK